MERIRASAQAVIRIERAGPHDRDQIVRLLAAASLPSKDLGDGVELYVARDGERIVGAIGLEGSAPDVLLRSLVVAPSERGRGVGRALVEHAEREALGRGVRALHLLTTTAEAFFARAGYARADRGEAPVSIRATEEFRTLCPDTAACMRRELVSA